jgi:hypothetical protein
MALRQGRDIDGAEKVPSELTSDTWREFLRARVEDLLDDERVVGAIDVAGADGVEPALDAMEGPDPRVVDTLTPAMSRGRKVVFHHAPEDLLGAVQA